MKYIYDFLLIKWQAQKITSAQKVFGTCYESTRYELYLIDVVAFFQLHHFVIKCVDKLSDVRYHEKYKNEKHHFEYIQVHYQYTKHEQW